jgi:cytochrome P450/predicted ester cyclase
LNQHDFDALDALLAPDLVHHGLPGITNRDDFKQLLVGYHRGFPDLVHTIEGVVTEGEQTAVRTLSAGTHMGMFLGHPPTGLRFSARAMSFYRIEGDCIREIWEVFDTVSMLQQLGLYYPVARSRAILRDKRAPGPVAEISLAQIRSDPLGFLARITREYGDYVRYVCEGRETILLNYPDAIRVVLHERESNYTKLNTPDLLLLKPMLGDGLLTTVGPVWRRDRESLQPALSRRELEGSTNVIVKVVHEMIARWRSRPDFDVPIDIVREMSRLTLEIAARVLFSIDLASQSEAFGQAMDVLNESMSNARPDNPDAQNRLQPALTFIRQIVWQAVLARRIYDSGEEDVLATLLRSQREHGDSDRHVVDQAITILLAGHETTAKAISWGFALLDAYPRKLENMLRELDKCLGGRPPQFADLARLSYTRAVIDEVLRLYPPIWLLTRTAVEDDEIAGYAVPAGSLVAISPFLMHRHTGFWEEPEAFCPERFLSGDVAMRACQYLPFGHGPRHCIGKSFAMLEMPTVLATIYSEFALKLLPNHVPEPEALVTLRPRYGLPMLLRDKRRSRAR